MAESAAGFGTMMGPVLAGMLYYYLKYCGAFLVFAVFLLVAGVISFFFISNSLNKKIEYETNEIDNEVQRQALQA
jgi:MFS family permease